jgi:hypothetical protein
VDVGAGGGVETALLDSELFFRPIVERYVEVPRLVRREWLIGELMARIDDEACRLVMLTGEPGSGKSSIIAQIADRHRDWPVYFLRRDQRAVLEDPSAKSFLARIGLQLAAAKPELISTDRVEIVVEQEIGEVGPGGAAVAANVERVLASPFRDAAVHVKQTVRRRALGEVGALRINELISDPRLLSVDDLRMMALVDPAQTLRRLRPEERLVVLVDALDEQPAAALDETIFDWLARTTIPDNVRIIATSRSDEPRLARLADQHGAAFAQLTLDAEDPRVLEDVRTYALKLVVVPEVASGLADARRESEGFVESVIAKADGNLGYLDTLDRALTRGDLDNGAIGELLSLSELPAGLNELHAFFLRQVRAGPGAHMIRVRNATTGVSGVAEAWTVLFRPVIELLCVAHEPLTPSAIVALAAVPADVPAVATGIARLRHLLDLTPSGFRFYHGSIREFLVAPTTAAEPTTAELHVDPIAAHRELASRLRAAAEDLWVDVPDQPTEQTRREYGRRHYIAHLCDGEWWDQLVSELDDGTYGRHKIRADPSGSEFCVDLDLVRTLASDGRPPLEDGIGRLPELWRYSLLRLNLASDADRYPAEGYAALALAGEDEQAARLASLIPSPASRVTILCRVVEELCAANHAALAPRFADAATEAAFSIQSGPELPSGVELVLDAWVSLTAAGVPPGPAVLELLGRLATLEATWASPAALGQLAEISLRTGQVEPVRAIAARLRDIASDQPETSEAACAVAEFVRVDVAAGETASALTSLDAIGTDDAETLLDVLEQVVGSASTPDMIEEIERRLQRLYEAREDIPGHIRTTSLARVAELQGRIGADDAATASRRAAAAAFLGRPPGLGDDDTGILGVSLATAGEHELYERVVDHLRTSALAGIEDTAGRQKQGHGYQLNFLTQPMTRTLANMGAFDAALEVARADVDGASGYQLVDIARALVRSERNEQALSVAGEITDVEEAREEALCITAIGLASGGEVRRALEIARTLSRDEPRSQALAGIALEVARHGEFELAITLAAEARSVFRAAPAPSRWLGVDSIFQLLTTAEEWDAAEELTFAAPELRPASLFDALVEAGEFERARALLQRWPADQRPQSLATLAAKLPEPEQSAAREEAEAAAREVADDVTRVNALRAVARACSDQTHARELLLEAMNVLNGVKNYPGRPTLWPAILGEFVHTGDVARPLAWARAFPAGEEFDAALALCLIHEATHATGAELDHKAVLEEAWAKALDVAFIPMRGDAVARVAIEFTRCGFLERALQAIDEPYVDRARTRRVVNHLADFGRPYDALEHLVPPPNPGAPTYTELAIAEALARAGDTERARRVIDEIDDVAHRASALAAIGENLLVRGERAAARATAEEVIASSEWMPGEQAPLARAAALLAHAARSEDLLTLVRERWQSEEDGGNLCGQLVLATPLLAPRRALALRLASTFSWLDAFLASI